MGKQQLQWNSGGWFGGQLGSTAWLLVAAVLASIQNLKTGLILALLFLLPNMVGLLLWYQRDNMSCYAAMQLLLVVIGIFSLAAVYVLHRNDLWLSIQKGGSVSAASGYLIILGVIILLMVNFYIRFGRHRES